jgi:hypothetical protein
MDPLGIGGAFGFMAYGIYATFWGATDPKQNGAPFTAESDAPDHVQRGP